MISKGMLKIDIIGQLLIMASMLLYIVFTPGSLYISSLLPLFILGFWQFFNGLIEAIFYRNKTRQKYIFTAIFYILSLITLPSIDNFYPAKISGFMETFSTFYFIVGALGFAGWYFYQTYKELEYSNHHPRSFWDYEF
ncbi:MAG: hypothetical protein ACI97N_002206 [Cognaticolwellia sp.]|jgi:hypothetical protein